MHNAATLGTRRSNVAGTNPYSLNGTTALCQLLNQVTHKSPCTMHCVHLPHHITQHRGPTIVRNSDMRRSTRSIIAPETLFHASPGITCQTCASYHQPQLMVEDRHVTATLAPQEKRRLNTQQKQSVQHAHQWHGLIDGTSLTLQRSSVHLFQSFWDLPELNDHLRRVN